MPELSPVVQGSENNNPSFLIKLAHGDFGLAKTFWIFVILTNFVFGIISQLIPIMAILFFLFFLIIIYQCALLSGIWNAARKYNGNKFWVILAKFYVAVGWILQVVAILILLVQLQNILL